MLSAATQGRLPALSPADSFQLQWTADPQVSPDGRQVADLGYDDAYQGYENARLQAMDRNGGSSRVVSASLDGSVDQIVRAPSGREVVAHVLAWFGRY